MEEPTNPDSPELTRAEKRKLKREQTREERKKDKAESNRKDIFLKAALGFVALMILFGIFLIFKSSSANAAKVDEFTKCLATKDVVIYGNEWCKYTGRQKSMFGESFKNLKYVICDEQKALCDEKQITITPTWEINGTMYRQVQTLEAISQLSGCSLR
ncbi:hypothetical protein HYU11_04150 [Candidatus Woesearchaeota archaeon]|nr:hypothetical protein [Candidatus Woesearchaeota archaeon]